MADYDPKDPLGAFTSGSGSSDASTKSSSSEYDVAPF